MKKILLLLLLLPLLVEARWPTFTIPMPDQLITALLFDTQSCQPGFAKVHQGTQLPVNLFNTVISPSKWYWEVTTTSNCFDMSKCSYLRHEIQRTEKSEVGFTTITAWYGLEGLPLFGLVFKTPPLGWQCYEIDPGSHKISCANDM